MNFQPFASLWLGFVRNIRAPHLPSHTILHTDVPHPLPSKYLFESKSATYTHSFFLSLSYTHAYIHTRAHTHTRSISTKKHFKIAQLIFMPLILAKKMLVARWKTLFKCFPGFYGFYKNVLYLRGQFHSLQFSFLPSVKENVKWD